MPSVRLTPEEREALRREANAPAGGRAIPLEASIRSFREQQARHYGGRLPHEADARRAFEDAVRAGSFDAILARFRDWQRERQIRNIPARRGGIGYEVVDALDFAAELQRVLAKLENEAGEEIAAGRASG